MRKLILILTIIGSGSVSFADGAPCPEGNNCGYDTCAPCPGYKQPKKICSDSIYTCIADKLQRLNGSIFNALTPEEIKDLLSKNNDSRRGAAVEAAISCQLGVEQ